jgi:hypothetical protein
MSVGSIVFKISRFQISISGKKVPTIKKFPFLNDSCSKFKGFILSHSNDKGNADN